MIFKWCHLWKLRHHGCMVFFVGSFYWFRFPYDPECRNNSNKMASLQSYEREIFVEGFLCGFFCAIILVGAIICVRCCILHFHEEREELDLQRERFRVQRRMEQEGKRLNIFLVWEKIWKEKMEHKKIIFFFRIWMQLPRLFQSTRIEWIESIDTIGWYNREF